MSNKLISSGQKNNCIGETIEKLNNILKYMTSLDYVKEMINDADIQAEMLETIASNSEELSSSIEEISTHVNDSNQKVIATVENTKSSLNNINYAFSEIEKNLNETENVKKTIIEVMEETNKVNDMVEVIKSVADQTNLLSFNASIEAKRAGEQGKSFGVVASEIKTLAENTKKQVEIINEIVEGVNIKASNASKEIERVLGNLSSSKAIVNTATSGLEEITTELENVEELFLSISSNVEEQTATTQEITSNIQTINTKAHKLKTESNKTGQAFFYISQEIDSLRIKVLECSSSKDKNLILDLSITDHLMWKWQIYNMLLGYVKLDLNEVGDHHTCRLGKWIDKQNNNDPKVSEIIDILERPHSHVHMFAKEAIDFYQQKNTHDAELCLEGIEESSKKVVQYLTDLKKYI